MRLVVLVLVLPSFIVAIGGNGVPAMRPVETVLWADIALLAAACAVAAVALDRMRVPGGLFFGPMFVSAIAHGSGLTTAQLPLYMLNVAMLALGAQIGARFAGVGWTFIRTTLVAGLVNLAAATAVALVFSALVAWALAIPFGQVLLAFAPGGAEAMAVLAFALNLDPAYVAVHHVARSLALGFLLPAILRFMGISSRRG